MEGVVELVVYGQFMASLDKRKAYKRKIYGSIALGIIIALIDILFIHSFWTLTTVAFLSQNIILANMALVYISNLLNHSDKYPNLLRFPPFLVSTGLLLYSLTCFFHYVTFDNLLAKNNIHFFFISYLVIEIACAFIYTFLGLAFLCFTRVKRLP